MTVLDVTSEAAAPASRRALAFVTGCGRSGTTLVGELLARHPEVRYLNDRADLWMRAFPIADVWGRHDDARSAGARVALTADDAAAHPDRVEAFARLLELERDGKPVLVEKLPINNFRLPFLRALYPDAPIINVVRHGVEVALSIQQRMTRGTWYGRDDRKWRLLVDHADAHGYGPLVARCTTPFLRGLLEWRMSVEAAEADLARDPDVRLLGLRYESLIARPLDAGRAMLNFLGLPPSDAVDRFAMDQVRRRSPLALEFEVPDAADAIAGDTLRRLGYWPS